MFSFRKRYRIDNNTLRNVANNIAHEMAILYYEEEILSMYQSQLEKLKEKKFNQFIDLLTKNNVNKFKKSINSYKLQESKITTNCYNDIIYNRNKIREYLFQNESNSHNLNSKELAQRLKVDKSFLNSKLVTYSEIPLEVDSLYTFEGFIAAMHTIKKDMDNKINISDVISLYIISTINDAHLEIIEYFKYINQKNTTLNFEEIIAAYRKKISIYLQTLKDIYDTQVNVNASIKQFEDGIKYKNKTIKLPSNEIEKEILDYFIFTDFEKLGNFKTLINYENHIKDTIQKKIDIYANEKGIEYNFIDLYNLKLNNQEEETKKSNFFGVLDFFKNKGKMNEGINHEKNMYNLLISSINYYRSLLNDSYPQEFESYYDDSSYPVLKYYFRTFNGLTYDILRELATLDTEHSTYEQTNYSAIHSLRLNYKQKINSLKEEYTELMQKSPESIKSIFTQFKLAEEKLLTQFDFLVSQYNSKLQDSKFDEDNNVIKLFSILSPKYYFTKSYQIKKIALNDANDKIAQKVYPDFTGFEKELRNEYQSSLIKVKKQLIDFGLSNELIEFELKDIFKNTSLEYEQDISNYRKNYLKNTDGITESLFKLDIYPLDKPYHSNFHVSDIIQNAVHNVVHNISVIHYLKTLFDDANNLLLNNYQSFSKKQAVSLNSLFNEEYENASLYEEKIITEYESMIELYKNICLKLGVQENYFTKEKLSVFIITDTYFENYSDTAIRRHAEYDKYNLNNKGDNLFIKKILEFYKRKITNLESEMYGSNEYQLCQSIDITTKTLLRKQEFEKELKAEINKIKAELESKIKKYIQITEFNIDVENMLERV